jgi:hypothetical protein
MEGIATRCSALIAGLLLGCGAPHDASEERSAERADGVQLGYVSFGGFHTILTSSTSNQAKSTGAIRGTNDGSASHLSCGATFVSKHYAVTAAHCVNQYAAGTGTFTVEQYTLSDLDVVKIHTTSSAISGTWPNWTRGPDLTAGDGWSKTDLTCSVKRRCNASEGGVHDCPSGIAHDVDLALIHCPGRSSSLPFAVTTSASDLNKEVEVWWFHEILALPNNPPVSGTNEYWDHYGKMPLPGNDNDNYHYRVKHQLFPLLATRRPTGQNYKTLGAQGSWLTQSEVPGCHGMSGSGNFQRGSTVVFGPSIIGGSSGTRLCEKMDDTAPGVRASGHVTASVTHTFVTGSAEVIADR